MPTNHIGLDEIRGALSKIRDPWEPGVTRLWSLPPEERVKYLGVVPPAGELSIEEVEQQVLSMQESLKAEAVAAVGAPAAYNLSDVGGKDYVTPIKDQSSCGSCVAFGTVATVESTLRVQRNDQNLAVDLSEAHLFFCHARARGYSCSSGWWPQQAYDDFKSKGVADEACYPYNLSNQDCSGLCSDWANRVTKITGYTTLTGKPANIKQWISTKGPVSACFIVYEDFFSYKSGIYTHVNGGKAGVHCVTIIGYNNNPGYWICKNSWGTDWGESAKTSGERGYFRIAYGQCGIDSWLNHGVNSIENTGWQANRRVIGLWTINQNRNAWAYIQGLGWRKISPDNDNIFFDMLAQLTAAKAASRPVNFYEDNGTIKQVYVF